MIFPMAEDAATKANRRRRIRESFAPPLNEIPLRHVDSVQALNEFQREILAKAIEKLGIRHLASCLTAMKDHNASIQSDEDLIGLLRLSDKPQRDANATLSQMQEGSSEDARQLSKLLIQCYPDMPRTSADALVASEVMAASMHVVAATRHALDDAKSDFVITVLYALFEERLNAISQIINSNPAFVKAIQRSRPDWNIKN